MPAETILNAKFSEKLNASVRLDLWGENKPGPRILKLTRFSHRSVGA